MCSRPAPAPKHADMRQILPTGGFLAEIRNKTELLPLEMMRSVEHHAPVRIRTQVVGSGPQADQSAGTASDHLLGDRDSLDFAYRGRWIIVCRAGRRRCAAIRKMGGVMHAVTLAVNYLAGEVVTDKEHIFRGPAKRSMAQLSGFFVGIEDGAMGRVDPGRQRATVMPGREVRSPVVIRLDQASKSVGFMQFARVFHHHIHIGYIFAARP